MQFSCCAIASQLARIFSSNTPPGKFTLFTVVFNGSRLAGSPVDHLPYCKLGESLDSPAPQGGWKSPQQWEDIRAVIAAPPDPDAPDGRVS